MKAVVVAGWGDYVFCPEDVEVWVVTDEEYELMMNEEKAGRSITPAKCIGVEHLANDILAD